MQIKITPWYHLTLVRMGISKNLQTVNAGDSVEKKGYSYIISRKVNQRRVQSFL